MSEEDPDSAIEPSEDSSEPEHINSDPEVTVTGNTGTIFVDRDWVTDNAVSSLRYIEEGTSCVHWGFDRRDNKWLQRNFWCFETHFEQGLDPVRI